MLRFILLCIFLLPALSKSVEKSHDQDLEEDFIKKPLKNLKNPHPISAPMIESTETNEQSHINDSSKDNTANIRQNRRAILSLFKHLFSTTEKPDYENKWEDMMSMNENFSNIAGLLQKLVNALNNLNKNLKRTKNDNYLLRSPTKQKRRNRFKRNVNNSEGDETTENITVINSNNVTSSNISNIGDQLLNNRYNDDNKSAIAYNETSSDKTTLSQKLPIFLPANSTLSTDPLSNGRRFALSKSSPILKEKLLIYLERMFYDIERGIKPLSEVKILLSDAISYRIGYIISNIDTLHIQLKKLKNEMDANKVFWTESKVKELFDKVKTSGDVVSNLLDILSYYMPQSTQLNVKQ